jgi:WD40 repeat protein
MRFHPRRVSILACAVGNQINIIDITSARNNSSNSGNASNSSNTNNMGIRTIATDHGKNICSFDWSTDGNFLAASSEDKICVYDTSQWKCVWNYTSESKISSCAFVKSGGNEKLRLLYGGYENIFLWQCGTPGEQPKKVGSQSGTVMSIACCSVAAGQQTFVASASHHQEKNLMLWTI